MVGERSFRNFFFGHAIESVVLLPLFDWSIFNRVAKMNIKTKPLAFYNTDVFQLTHSRLGASSFVRAFSVCHSLALDS